MSSHPEYPALLEVNEVVLKACESDPRRRYASAKAMEADLALVQSGLSIRRLRGVERRLALMKRTGMVGTTLLAITTAGLLYQHLQTRRVERERRTAEQLLYAADMGLAQQALEAGNLVRATTLREAHRPGSTSEIRNAKSEFGPDLRGFEWYYLKHLCRGEEAHTFRRHQQAVRGVAISPDGKLLASGSDDQTIRLWNLPARRNLTTLRGHHGAVNAVAFAPDGILLASGSADKTVKLWDVGTGTVVADLANHASAVTAVAFTPEGKRLAVATEEASLKLWEIKTGRELHDFFVVVYGCCFDRGGWGCGPTFVVFTRVWWFRRGVFF